ncbi:MAG: NepR family anti-sigma factor [Pseudomonadota bacterium]
MQYQAVQTMAAKSSRERPDQAGAAPMSGQTSGDAPTTDGAAGDFIGDNLRRLFDDLAQEPMPNRITDLLAQLAAQEAGAAPAATSAPTPPQTPTQTPASDEDDAEDRS